MENTMHYVCLPTQTEDLNWIPWFILGHTDPSCLTEGAIAGAINAGRDQFMPPEDEDDEWPEPDAALMIAYLQSLGYFAAEAKLNWGMCEWGMCE